MDTAGATALITSKLQSFLEQQLIDSVHVASATVAPPPLAYATHFPRLSVVLSGTHPMQLANQQQIRSIHLRQGQAIFMPAHCWNLPEWSKPATELTFLFGTRQIGVSCVQQTGQTPAELLVTKTSLHGPYDPMTQGLLEALNAMAEIPSPAPLDRLIVTAMLHSCLRALRQGPSLALGKSRQSYDSICLYMQANAQSPLTRESIASLFNLSPGHVSRLFQQEGAMRFNDYLNYIRINRAKFLLRQFGIPLKEISERCGYSSTAYFCRTFRQITKLTPTEYRTQKTE